MKNNEGDRLKATVHQPDAGRQQDNTLSKTKSPIAQTGKNYS